MKPLVIASQTRPVTITRFNNDGDLFFTGGLDGTVNAFWTSPVERLGTYNVTNRAVKWLSVSDTNEFLSVATGDGKIHIFRVETGEKVASKDISPMYLR